MAPTPAAIVLDCTIAQVQACDSMDRLLSECSEVLEARLLPKLDMRSQLSLAGSCGALRRWLFQLPPSFHQVKAYAPSKSSLRVLVQQQAVCLMPCSSPDVHLQQA